LRRPVAILLTGAIGFLLPSRVNAQCATNNIGAVSLNNTGTASAPVSDTFFNSTNGSFSYSTQGMNLYIANNNKVGIAPQSIQASNATISNFPSPVPLHNNAGFTSVFVAGGDAIVKRFDVDSLGVPVQKCASPSLGRGAAVCPGDTLMATPSPQLYDYSSSTFQQTVGDDLVYITTYHMCNDSIRNQIIALKGSDCSIFWRFNGTGNYSMDYGAEACEVDYVRDRVYCGTHLPTSHTQPTAWAVSSYDGSFVNDYNADSMITRPVLRGNIVYMGAQSGSLWAFDITNGSLKWIQPVSTTSITRTPWVERRPSGGFTSVILVTDTVVNGVGGQLHSVTDNGPSATVNWTYTPIKAAHVNTAPVINDKASKVYVGQDNGELHQLNLLTGADEQYTMVGTATDLVFDPALDADSKTATSIDRLRATSTSANNNLRTYCVPWPLGGAAGTMSLPPDGTPPPAQPQVCPVGCYGASCTTCSTCNIPAPPGPFTTSCATCSWNSTTDVWEIKPINEGMACDDHNPCTCDTAIANMNGGMCPVCALACSPSDVCRSGQCVGNFTDASCIPGSPPGGTAPCINPGDVGACANRNGVACTSPAQCPVDHPFCTAGHCRTITQCCGATLACVDILNDSKNCGACGRSCDSNRFGLCGGSPCITGAQKCVKGVCVRDPTYFCGTGSNNVEANLLNGLTATVFNQLSGADNLSYGTVVSYSPTAPQNTIKNGCNPVFSNYNLTGSGTCQFSTEMPTWNNGLLQLNPSLNGFFGWTESDCVLPPGPFPPAFPFHGSWLIDSSTFVGARINDQNGNPTATPNAAFFAYAADVITDGGFENAIVMPPWSSTGTTSMEVSTIVTSPAPPLGPCHNNGTNNTRCWQLGNTTAAGNGDAYLSTTVTIPANAFLPVGSRPPSRAQLSFWYKPFSMDGPLSTDVEEAQLRNSTDTATLLQLLAPSTYNSQTWTQVINDVSAWQGQTVVVKFHVHDDANGLFTYMLVDDVVLTSTNTPPPLQLPPQANTDDTKQTGPVIETGSSPFNNIIYNQGVVGPVASTRFSNGQAGVADVFFANWPSDGSLFWIRADCGGDMLQPVSPGTPGCSYPIAQAAPGWPPVGFPPIGTSAARITSLAIWGNQWWNYTAFPSTPCPPTATNLTIPQIFATVGSKVWTYYQNDYCTSSSRNSSSLWADINNGPNCNSPLCTLPHACFAGAGCCFNSTGCYDQTNAATQAIVGFLSSSVDPIYGDLYLEGLDVSGNHRDFMLYTPNLPTGPAAAPLWFFQLGDVGHIFSQAQNYVLTGDGRISSSGGMILRMVVNGPNMLPTFQNEVIWP
jgi:hypothetical protein